MPALGSSDSELISRQSPTLFHFSLKTTYLISLIVVTLLLLLLIALIIVLLATRMLVFNREPAVNLASAGAEQPTPTGPGRQSSLGGAAGGGMPLPEGRVPPQTLDGQLTPLPSAPGGPLSSLGPSGLTPQPSAPPPAPPTGSSGSTTYPSSPSPSLQSTSQPQQPSPTQPAIVSDRYERRTFECEFFVQDQANDAYGDSASFEYGQAVNIVLRALNAMLEGSTLRDMRPGASVERIENR